MFVDLLGKTRIRLSLHATPDRGGSADEIAAEYLDHV